MKNLIYILTCFAALLGGTAWQEDDFLEKTHPTFVAYQGTSPYRYSSGYSRTSSTVAKPAMKSVSAYRNQRRIAHNSACQAYAAPSYPSTQMQSTSTMPMTAFASSAQVTVVGGGAAGAGVSGNYSKGNTGRGVTYASAGVSVPQMQMLTTSTMSAGTAVASGVARRGLRQAIDPPGTIVAGCGCVDTDGDGICDRCGKPMPDELDGGCGCEDEGPGHCWCPLDGGWEVMLFMALLSLVYVLVRRRSIAEASVDITKE